MTAVTGFHLSDANQRYLATTARRGRLTPDRSPGSSPQSDPLPTCVHEIRGGMRVHGSWLDERKTSEKTGRFSFASSRFCRASSANWSGMGEKPKLGPSYPRLSRSQIL